MVDQGDSSTATPPTPQAWGDVAHTFKAPTKSVTICARADLVADLERLVALHAEVERNDDLTNEPDQAPAVAEQITALRAEMTAAMVTFVFRPLSRKGEADLRAEHPPTEEQQALAKTAGIRAVYNVDTFPPTLAHKMCISPTGMSQDDWNNIFESWTDGQLSAIEAALFEVSHGVSDIPKALGVYKPQER